MTYKSITVKSLYPPGMPGASGPPLGVHLFSVGRGSYPCAYCMEESAGGEYAFSERLGNARPLPLALQCDVVFLLSQGEVGEKDEDFSSSPIPSWAVEWKLPLFVETRGEGDKHPVPQRSWVSLKDSLSCSEPQFPHL